MDEADPRVRAAKSLGAAESIAREHPDVAQVHATMAVAEALLAVEQALRDAQDDDPVVRRS